MIVNTCSYITLLILTRINESTGEVSQECPWLGKEQIPSAAPNKGNVLQKRNSEKDFGTGSLVYDDKELNELLVMLDATQK